jgi:hypothetical protein
MTGALLGLQALSIVLLAVAFAMARRTRSTAWLWIMGLAALGIVVCVGLATWGTVRGLGQTD